MKKGGKSCEISDSDVYHCRDYISGRTAPCVSALPDPGQRYGMLLLFFCLCTGIIKVKQIEETAEFLLAVMPVLFVGPGVGILENYTHITANFPIFLLTVLFSTAVVMGVTGLAVQAVMTVKRKAGKQHE